MGLQGSIVCVLLVLAISGGAYFQGRQDGAAHVRVEWEEARRAASDLADAERKKEQEKARALSRRYEAKIATQAITNREITAHLEIAIGKANTPAACVITDGVRDSINAALAGESPATGKLPPASGEVKAAVVQ